MSHVTLPISVEFEGRSGEWSIQELGDDQQLVFHETGVLTHWDARMVSDELLEDLPIDPRKVRDEFLAIKSDEQALAFLQRYGLFAKPEPGIPVEGQSAIQPMPQAGIISLADVIEWTGILRQLLVTPPEKWGLPTTADEPFELESTGATQPGLEFKFGGILDALPPLKAHAIATRRWFDVRFRWERRKEDTYKKFIMTHAAVISVHDVLGALLATVYVDNLFGARFGICARKICGNLFELKSKHEKKYCCYKCAHAEVVQRGRLKNRRAAKKLKRKQTARKRTR
jgi:hypothetical protein